jgi:hypothetical protein
MKQLSAKRAALFVPRLSVYLFIWFLWSIRIVQFSHIIETDEINQIDLIKGKGRNTGKTK